MSLQINKLFIYYNMTVHVWNMVMTLISKKGIMQNSCEREGCRHTYYIKHIKHFNTYGDRVSSNEVTASSLFPDEQVFRVLKVAPRDDKTRWLNSDQKRTRPSYWLICEIYQDLEETSHKSCIWMSCHRSHSCYNMQDELLNDIHDKWSYETTQSCCSRRTHHSFL